LALHIPYKFGRSENSDKTEERKLLLKKEEIAKLMSYRKQKYMLIPTAIFLARKWFKLEIGIGRMMRKFEKREKIKARETKLQIARIGR
jgi:SsrA-binding protein